MMRVLLLAALLQALLSSSNAFTSPSSPVLSPVATARKSINTKSRISPLYNTPENTASEEESSSTTLTLEEKMKSWEASEEEIRAATLGGVIPGSSSDKENRTDAFDIGLYIAFPIMVIGCLAFAFFPLIVSNIDVTSVGPPPTS
mmetsp:Transcript_6190/g.9658  ORF Transcript_6190/g.9658 Transcript_6190/m.9658 type:complete len:145 (+) Transcript_6190:91-525(+)